MPTLEPYTLAIRYSQRNIKNCKRVCLANAHFRTKKETSENKAKREKHYAQQCITAITADSTILRRAQYRLKRIHSELLTSVLNTKIK